MEQPGPGRGDGEAVTTEKNEDEEWLFGREEVDLSLTVARPMRFSRLRRWAQPHAGSRALRAPVMSTVCRVLVLYTPLA